MFSEDSYNNRSFKIIVPLHKTAFPRETNASQLLRAVKSQQTRMRAVILREQSLIAES